MLNVEVPLLVVSRDKVVLNRNADAGRVQELKVLKHVGRKIVCARERIRVHSARIRVTELDIVEPNLNGKRRRIDEVRQLKVSRQVD